MWCYCNNIFFFRHYSDPIIPQLPGISEFSGRVLHSHSYRDPVDTQGQKVLVLGAGPSGIDIALEIADYATEV